MSEPENNSTASYKKNEAETIIFDDALDITLVTSYFEQFCQLLNEQKAIVLNGEKIERIDGAGLQLLAAFFKSAGFLQINVHWQGISEPLKRSAEISGLTGILALD